MDKKSNAEQNGKDKDKESKGSAPQERLKALGMALDSIKKAYGEGSIMRLGDSRHQAHRSGADRRIVPGRCVGRRRLAARQNH